jgi:hypothetical protein
MDVNSILSDIRSFWNTISVPIVFHFIFYFVYCLLHKPISVKARLETLVASNGFARTKKLLQEFELWSKFPWLLLIAILFYLTMVNILIEVMTSPNIYPLKVSYSSTDFIREYPDSEAIRNIAHYGKTTNPSAHDIDNIRLNLLDYYQLKYKERYQSWVQWRQDDFAKISKYYHYSFLTFLLTVTLFIFHIYPQSKGRIRAVGRFSLVCLGFVISLFVQLHKYEQAIENEFAASVNFVNNSLKVDNDRKMILDSAQLPAVDSAVMRELNFPVRNKPFWISRWLQNKSFFTMWLGERTLRTRNTEDPHRFQPSIDDSGNPGTVIIDSDTAARRADP